jgi:lipoprotein NlpI
VIELYLGRLSPADVSRIASTPDDACEAQFYSGEWHLLHGNYEAAAAALKVAVDTCPKTFVEYRGAIAELKRLRSGTGRR